MLIIEAPQALQKPASYFAKLLGIEGIEGEIQINWYREEGREGYCADCGDYIEIGVRFNAEEMLSTLAHEMTHAKQYLTGELRDMRQGTLWRDKFFKNHLDGSHEYWNSPWEREAQNNETDLVVKYITEFFT